jgi:hypothetical protein
MKRISKMMIAFCLAAVALMPSFADASSRGRCNDHRRNCNDHRRDCNHRKCVKDPIVGTWLFKFTIPNEDSIINGVIKFDSDNTFMLHDTGNLTQNILGNRGAYFTVNVGKWRRVGEFQYQIVGTEVVLSRDINCVSLPSPSCLAETAIPVFRFKATGDFLLDSNLQNASIPNFTVVSHPLDDLTLTQPGPFPPLPTTSFVLQKLDP